MDTHVFIANETKNETKHQYFSQRLKQWVQVVFDRPHDDVIMVSELSCSEPFCPDVMTLFVFWEENNLRKEYRMYKQLRFISQRDVEDAKTSMLNVLINKELAEEHAKNNPKP